MKNFFYILILTAFVVSSCSSGFVATSGYDDVYYYPGAETPQAPVAEKDVPDKEIENMYYPIYEYYDDGTTAQADYYEEEYYYGGGGGTTNIYNYYGDYYEDSYARRLNKFHGGFYHDPFYYDPFWHTGFRFRYGYGYPHMGFSWMIGFGYHNPWHWAYWHHPFGYYNPYHLGYWHGYHHGYWHGSGASDIVSYIGGSSSGTHYGPRGSRGGAPSGDIRPERAPATERMRPESAESQETASVPQATRLETPGNIEPASARDISGVSEADNVREINRETPQRVVLPDQTSERERPQELRREPSAAEAQTRQTERVVLPGSGERERVQTQPQSRPSYQGHSDYNVNRSREQGGTRTNVNVPSSSPSRNVGREAPTRQTRPNNSYTRPGSTNVNTYNRSTTHPSQQSSPSVRPSSGTQRSSSTPTINRSSSSSPSFNRSSSSGSRPSGSSSVRSSSPSRSSGSSAPSRGGSSSSSSSSSGGGRR